MADDAMETVPIDGVANWRLARDAGQLLWLTFDCAGSSTNTLSSLVLAEFDRVLETICAAGGRGLVMTSAKPAGFAAGADIREFDAMRDIDETARRLADVHQLFERLERLHMPSVARVHGFCLGGGLELALACRHIVAASDGHGRIGFPEVLLGIHPGFGGTVRAARCCGALAALDLILSGRGIDARRAERIGLIDRAVPLRHLDAAARYFAAEWRTRRAPARYTALASQRFARPLVAAALRREVSKRAREQHYPAPHAVLRLWREHAGNARAMYRAEARSVAALLTSPTSRNLVRLFRLQERLKHLGSEAPTAVRHVHVVGAGIMGGDIAAWCALRGFRVTLQDPSLASIGNAFKRAVRLFDRRLREPAERLAVRDRLVMDLAGNGAARADVIIEAIVEDAAAKRELFRDLAARARDDALLATNTSSIPLADLAVAMDDPSRLVGMHFFNPVERMQLVEVIGDTGTSSEALARARAFVVAIGRLPLPTASTPGFLVNRILSPYLQEAMILLDEGVPAGAIDAIARRFGMAMGPLELADTVGLDICLHVGENLAATVGGEVPAVLRRLVRERRLGVKSGAGFHDYPSGWRPGRRGGDGPLPMAEVRDRMLLRLLNEAIACVREGVVADADLVDAGMVFATGFAPCRGGPIMYARDLSVGEVLSRLRQLEARCGERFRPEDGWALLEESA